MSETQEAVKPVTFYAWMEHIPSSVRIRISGGEQVKDANGRILPLGQKEAHFLKGKFTTDDPETIATLRGFIRKGDTMTEDPEVFMQHTENPERRARRMHQKAEAFDAENAALKKENERLKALLAERPTRQARGLQAKTAETAD